MKSNWQPKGNKMNNWKYVLVDADTHEIWVNQYGGDLPPMTKQEILHYFYDKTWEEISSEYHIRYYPVHEEHRCPHCNTPLCQSETEGYKWQCFYCDEDFCDFETRDADHALVEALEEIQSICIGADSPDAQEHGERDPIEELQCCREDISAISNITERLLQIIEVQ